LLSSHLISALLPISIVRFDLSELVESKLLALSGWPCLSSSSAVARPLPTVIHESLAVVSGVKIAEDPFFQLYSG
jgi:hypothetical protein